MCERMEEKEEDRRRGRWEEVGDTGHRTGVYSGRKTQIISYSIT